MADKYRWVPRSRTEYADDKTHAMSSSSAASHPLGGLLAKEAPKSDQKDGDAGKATSTSTVIANPLDPLSMASAEAAQDDYVPPSSGGGDDDDETDMSGFVPWAVKKSGIMKKYNTSKTIPIVIKFMADEAEKGPGGPQDQKQGQSDKVKARLDQLDDTEEGLERKVLHMSQQEYIAHIEKLHDNLKNAWRNDERVKAIKLVIQASKFLSDTSVPQFYPSMFVLITEILDTFGGLVYDRIYARAAELYDGGRKMPKTGITPDIVHAEARETCRNWFYKIASIRELVPRIYVELAIMRCYDFIADKKDYAQVLSRIGAMIRGVGDPLCAVYARTYLARKGFEVDPKLNAYLVHNFNDFTLTFKPQLTSREFKKKVKGSTMSMPDYMDLFSPALDWIIQCAAYGTNEKVFFAFIDRYRKFAPSALVLNHILGAFDPSLVSVHAVKLAELVKGADASAFSQGQLYATFCLNCVMHPPPEEDRLPLLNSIWKVVTKFTDIKDYVLVADCFIEFPLKYFSPREVNTILTDLYRHLKVDNVKDMPDIMAQIHSILRKVLTQFSFSKVLLMDAFMPLVDLFQDSTDIARSLLHAFCHADEATRDPFIIHAMFECAKTLHDSITSLSLDDEKREVSDLLCRYVHRVEYGYDFEKHLSFFVDCRQNFPAIDAVKGHLVSAVNALVMRTLRLVKNKHNKKTLAFVKACLAYNFITVPSMEDIFSRLYLYLYSGQVALANGLVAQAEAMFKAAITLLPTVPNYEDADGQIRPTEERLTSWLAAFAGALVYIPGHPEHGPFYLIKGVLNVVREYQWEKTSDGKIKFYLNVIVVLCAQYQDHLPYGASNVMSNDQLYGGDPVFHEELMALIDTLLTQIVQHLQDLSKNDSASTQKRVGELALDLLNTLLATSTLNSKTVALAANLHQMAAQCTQVSKAYLRNTVAGISGKDGHFEAELARKIKA